MSDKLNRYAKARENKLYGSMDAISNELNEVSIELESLQSVTIFGTADTSLYRLAKNIVSLEETPAPTANTSTNTSTTSNTSSTTPSTQNQNAQDTAAEKAAEKKAQENSKKNAANNKSLLANASALIKKIFARLMEILKAILRFLGMSGEETKVAAEKLNTDEGANDQLADAVANSIEENGGDKDAALEVAEDMKGESLTDEEIDAIIKGATGEDKKSKGWAKRVLGIFAKDGAIFGSASGIKEFEYHVKPSEVKYFSFNGKWNITKLDDKLPKICLSMVKYYVNLIEKLQEFAKPGHYLENVKKSITDQHTAKNEGHTIRNISKLVVAEIQQAAKSNTLFQGPISDRKANKAIDVSAINPMLASDRQALDVFTNQTSLPGIGPNIVSHEIKEGFFAKIKLKRSDAVEYLKHVESALEEIEAISESITKRDPFKVDLRTNESALNALADASIVESDRELFKGIVIKFHNAFVSFVGNAIKNLIEMIKEVIYVFGKQREILLHSLTVSGDGNKRNTIIGRIKSAFDKSEKDSENKPDSEPKPKKEGMVGKLKNKFYDKVLNNKKYE